MEDYIFPTHQRNIASPQMVEAITREGMEDGNKASLSAIQRTEHPSARTVPHLRIGLRGARLTTAHQRQWLLRREDGRYAWRAFGAVDFLESRHFDIKNLAVANEIAANSEFWVEVSTFPFAARSVRKESPSAARNSSGCRLP